MRAVLQEPWSWILPANPDTEKQAVQAVARFCSLNAILVDGDPNMLPWVPESSDLCHLVHQVLVIQKWSGHGDPITMLGAALRASSSSPPSQHGCQAPRSCCR